MSLRREVWASVASVTRVRSLRAATPRCLLFFVTRLVCEIFQGAVPLFAATRLLELGK